MFKPDIITVPRLTYQPSAEVINMMPMRQAQLDSEARRNAARTKSQAIADTYRKG